MTPTPWSPAVRNFRFPHQGSGDQGDGRTVAPILEPAGDPPVAPPAGVPATRLQGAAFVLFLVLFGGGLVWVHGRRAAPSAIQSIRIDRLISPNHDGRHDRGTVSFKTTVDERIDVLVTGPGLGRVALARNRIITAYQRSHAFTWDGRSAAGRPAPSGTYAITVTFDRTGRTFVLPKRFRVDTVPPHPTLGLQHSTSRRVVVSIRGCGHDRKVTALDHNGRRLTPFTVLRGGRRAIGQAGPSATSVQLSCQDAAGNVGKATLVLRRP